ncbi:type IV pilus modification PilV family protein [Roseibacillus persicicus]|uniref:Uncharacterized protein n=1 Tax=Roseibacillus persicicus TaxID=454148 RepID=A0A918TGX1_9BACT|nr:hypothetical protein [Roseibacillus persicicus]GHC47037.1 hypothetical protein GCM10007100_10960 [Roseibacillus persicicus]
MKRFLEKKKRNGFSLIATITMMVLLSLIAVGLLSLSATVLRSSSADLAQLEARANARLALQLAIGQLQEAAGPDQRITAPANLRNPGDSPALTGVWESLKLDPNGGQNLDSIKNRSQGGTSPDGEFVTWLNSDSYGQSPTPDSPTDRSDSQQVRLLHTPGSAAPEEVTARVLSVNNGEGGVAWMTIDESVKARFNLPETSDLANQGDSEANVKRDRLRNPERTSTETISVVGRVPTEREAGKIASFEQGSLFTGQSSQRFREFYHDLTSWSLGVLSNPVDGGLKKDLTVAFESENDPTSGSFVYTQTSEPLAEGEPYMSTLREYYRLYRTNSEPTTPLGLSIPDGYSPFIRDRRTREYVPDPVPVDGVVIAPVVSRVNVVFSLVGRQAHDHWATTIPNQTGDPRRNQMVYLIYTPVVTLYNPYTKPITVQNLQVSFKHLPLAFRFFRNGSPQNVRPALLSQMHIPSQSRTDWEDSFQCTLSETAGGSAASAVTLSPGESRVFGLNHPAGTRWGEMSNYLWTEGSLSQSKTLDITTGQGYNQNSGFVVDWLVPAGAGQAPDAKTGTFGVRTTDAINVEFTPKVPTDSSGKAMTNFSINIAASINGSRRPQQIGAYRYTYGSEQRLKEAFEEGEHPELGGITFPYAREKAWRYNELFQPNVESAAVEDWTGPKQFAVFTMATRTSHDSLYPARPGLETSFVHNVLDMDITSAHPAQMPMEISFLPTLSSAGSTNNVGSVEVWSKDDPRTFFFSGWTVDKGFTNYPSIEIPRTPVTNLTQFRNAHLASSGHLPMPAQTVGDSHAHPLIPSGQAVGTNSSFDYSTLDHAWLANNALYDRFFLSGMRESDEFVNFLNGQDIPYNSRSEAYMPVSQDLDSAVDLYQDRDQGWASTAAFQLVKGAFNVNSTSVEAWKALLRANVGADIPLLNPASLQTDVVKSADAAFPRVLDGPSGAIHADEAFIENQTRWTGFRELSESEIESLAESIVENVRLRGPFTSLSEFVNRRLETGSTSMSLRGTLQQAIEEAGLNSQLVSDRYVSEDEASDFEYANPDAAVGDTEAASAAFLTQSDLLGAIGNALTVRGDTFVVRAYGDSKNKSGQIVARATCEAVVQRLPDYVDPQDSLYAKPKDFAQSEKESMKSDINEKFGRRFVVRSFRWLSEEEV